MRRHVLGLNLIAGLSVAMAGTALASEPAFIASYGGKNLSLTRGAENLPVDGQKLLMRGDRLQAGKASYVEVKYLADGCVLRVAEGRSIVVADRSPCAASIEAETDASSISVPAESETRIVPAAAGDEMARVTERTGPMARANLGAGMVELKKGMTLPVGSTVFAGQQSTVTVYFLNAKCSYTLPAETYIQVTERAPCVPSDDTADSSSGSNESSGAEANDIGLALGAAAVLVGGGALVVIALSGDDEDDDNPATPN